MSPQLIGLVPYEDGVEVPTELLWPPLTGPEGKRNVGSLGSRMQNKALHVAPTFFGSVGATVKF